ncbi:MAG: Crp/Fnr family transcriptional regulator [Magnetococcales bacterium]|nr:Crp/Fnr family transcriptional regulator [Magnetococcales bacterium]
MKKQNKFSTNNWALQNSYLFSSLSQSQLEEVEKSMRRIKLKKREILFQEGDSVKRFFLLNKGLVKLFRVSVNGTEKVISISKPGDTFATAMMFMEDPRYPVTASAIENSEVLAFENKAFLELLRKSPETSFRLLGILSLKLQCQVSEIDGLCLQNASCRLVRFLIGQLPENSDDSAEVQLNVPKQIIASRISIQPESFSRILRGLSRKGLVNVKNRTVEIPSVKKLKEEVISCGRSI